MGVATVRNRLFLAGEMGRKTAGSENWGPVARGSGREIGYQSENSKTQGKMQK
jgi:hypothetical protein